MTRRNLFLVYLTLLCAGFSGCANRAPIAKSPYQIAVETYYAELEKAGPDDSLDGASAAVKSAITANPASLETRVLYLNILLQRAFLRPPSSGARDQFIAEFRRLQFSPPGTPALDWVRPRTYITLADYLLRLGIEESERDAEPASAHRAKAAFQSAADLYVLGNKLAGTAKEGDSAGLVQERGNALDGYIQSQRGVIDMLTRLEEEPANTELVRQIGDPVTARLSAMFEKGDLPAALFSFGLLTQAALTAQMRHNQDIANRSGADLAKWCGANKAIAAREFSTLTTAESTEYSKGLALLRDLIRFRELELARGYMLVQVFGVADETAETVVDLSNDYRGLAAACQ